MELWNDFEGKTLDGQYRLERLIGPKGRSAFFEGQTDTGERTTVRVIESLNDEDEILARWNAVRLLESPQLLTILDAKKTVLDDVHLVYAVLEQTDAELADILKERPLSAEEARLVAAAVLGGLEALHGRGLIHEHVEPSSVLACGDEVKLRSDCVREAPEGAEGETMRRRDAHDAAMLIGQALTQRRDVGSARLPRPFDELVRNGMSGTWGLKEMNALVQPVAVSASAASAAAAAKASGSRAGRGGRADAGVAEVLSGGTAAATAAANGTAGPRAGSSGPTPIRRADVATTIGSTVATGSPAATNSAAAAGPAAARAGQNGGRTASDATKTSAAAVAAALRSAPGERESTAPMRG